MSIIPILKPRDILRILLKAGFKIVRQSGSHIRLIHGFNRKRQTTVPKHNSDIPRKLLNKILKQSSISTKEFLVLLRD